MSDGLTETVLQKVRQDFSAADQAEAIRLLIAECGRNLPLLHNADSRELERVQLDVLRLSQGSLDKLLEWIIAAQRDWRDVIVAAEYYPLPGEA